MGNSISDSLQNTARNINNGVQETSRHIHNAIQDGVSTAERNVNASIVQMQQKWKEALDKLSIVFSF